MDQHADFLRALRARPYSRSLRLQYGDWLQDRGDPRGAFVNLQCRAADLPHGDPRRLDFKAEADALLRRHEPDWLGPLAGHISNWHWDRGLLDWIAVDADTFLKHAAEWLPQLPVLGVFLRKARGRLGGLAECPQLAYLRFLYLSENGLVDDDIRALVGSPAVSELRELELQGNDIAAGSIAALAESPHLERLRSLHVGYNRFAQDDVAALADARSLRRLRSLNVMMTRVLGPGLTRLLDSPICARLQTLNLHFNHLPHGTLRRLGDAPCAEHLRELIYSFNALAPGDVAGLASSPRLAKLRRLELCGVPDGWMMDADIEALAATTHLTRLESLGFSFNPIGAAGAAALARSPAMRSLSSLNWMSRQDQFEDTQVALVRGPFLRRLRNPLVDNCIWSPRAVEILAASRRPFRWRRFIMHRSDAASIETLEKLMDRNLLRNLTTLQLCGSAREVAVLLPEGRLPQLRRLDVYGLNPDEDETRRLLAAPLLGQLHELALSCRDDWTQGGAMMKAVLAAPAVRRIPTVALDWSLDLGQVQALVADNDWPNLMDLTLGSLRMGSGGATALAGWPVLRQLRWLKLHNASSQSVTGLAAIAESPYQSPLLRIDILNGSLAKEGADVVRAKMGARVAGMGHLKPHVVVMGGWHRLEGDG